MDYAQMDWRLLVDQIKTGDARGMEHLYGVFSRGIRYYLRRRLGAQDVEDTVHDTFLIVVNTIRRGKFREPDRLMSFVRTVVRRQVAAHIAETVKKRHREVDPEAAVSLDHGKQNLEQEAMLPQEAELMKITLA